MSSPLGRVVYGEPVFYTTFQYHFFLFSTIDSISIAGISKAALLFQLCQHANHDPVTPMLFLAFPGYPVTMADCESAISRAQVTNDWYFYYFKGRCIKTDIGGSTLSPRLYDRDHGTGSALEAVEAARHIN